MINDVNYRAKREEFIVFLSDAIENNNAEQVKKWVNDVLLSCDNPLSQDKKVAFLEAEKLQLLSYIENKEFDHFKSLFGTISNNNNEKLNKLQCKILAEYLIEKQEELTSDNIYNKELGKLLNSLYHQLTKKHQDEMSSKVNEALKVVQYDQKQESSCPMAQLTETNVEECQHQKSPS